MGGGQGLQRTRLAGARAGARRLCELRRARAHSCQRYALGRQVTRQRRVGAAHVSRMAIRGRCVRLLRRSTLTALLQFSGAHGHSDP